MDSEIGSGTGGMIVKRVSVPVGLEELMEGLVKEVLITKPDDIYIFAAKYFSQLLTRREKTERGQHKVKTMRSAQSFKDQGEKRHHTKIPVQAGTKQLSRQFSIRGEPANQDLNIVSQKPKMYNRNELKYKRRNTGPQTILENQSLIARKHFSKSVSTEKSRDAARSNARKETKRIDSPRDTFKNRKEDMTKSITGIIPGISKDKIQKELVKTDKIQKDVIEASVSISSDETNEDQSSAKTNDSSGDVVNREEESSVKTQSMGLRKNEMNMQETVENDGGNVPAKINVIDSINVSKDMSENIKTVPNSEGSKGISMEIDTSIQAKDQRTNSGAEDIERNSSKDGHDISNTHYLDENEKNKKNVAVSKLDTELVEQRKENFVGNEGTKQQSDNIETDFEIDQSSTLSEHFQEGISKACDSITMKSTSQEVLEDEKEDITVSVKMDEKTQSAMNKIETDIEKEKISDEYYTLCKDNKTRIDEHSDLVYSEKINDPDGLRIEEKKEDSKSNLTTGTVEVEDREHKLEDHMNEISSKQSISSRNDTETDNEMMLSSSDNNELGDEINNSKIQATDESKNIIEDPKQLVYAGVPKSPSSKDELVIIPVKENNSDDKIQLESAAMEKNKSITTVTDEKESSDQENQVPKDINVVEKNGSDTLVDKSNRSIAMSESYELQKDNQENVSTLPRSAIGVLSNPSEMKNKEESSLQSSFYEVSLNTSRESVGSEENIKMNPDDMSMNQDSVSAKDPEVVKYVTTSSGMNENATAIRNGDEDETKDISADIEEISDKKVKKSGTSNERDMPEDIKRNVGEIEGNSDLTGHQKSDENVLLTSDPTSQIRNNSEDNENQKPNIKDRSDIDLKNYSSSEVYVRDEVIENIDGTDMKANRSEEKGVNKTTDKPAEADVSNGVSKKQGIHKGKSAAAEEITDKNVTISKRSLKSVGSNEKGITGDKQTILNDVKEIDDVSDCHKNNKTLLVTTEHNSNNIENSGPINIQDCSSTDESKNITNKNSNVNDITHLKNEISSLVRNNENVTKVNLNEEEDINKIIMGIQEKSDDHAPNGASRKQEVHEGESAAADITNDYVDTYKQKEESVDSKRKGLTQLTLHNINENNEATDFQKMKEIPEQNSNTIEISGYINDRDCTSIDESKDIKSQTANEKAGSNGDLKNDSSSELSSESYVKDEQIRSSDENVKEANHSGDELKTITMNVKEKSGGASGEHETRNITNGDEKRKIMQEECFTSYKDNESKNKDGKSENIQGTSISAAQESKVEKVKEDSDKGEINEGSKTPDGSEANCSDDKNEQGSINSLETEHIEKTTTISSSTKDKSNKISNNLRTIPSSTGNHTTKRSADSDDYSSRTSIENSTKETLEKTDDDYKSQLTTDGALTEYVKNSCDESKEVVIENPKKYDVIENAVKTVHNIPSDIKRVSSVDEEPFEKKIVTTLGEVPKIDRNDDNTFDSTESMTSSVPSMKKEVKSRENVHGDGTKSVNKELSLIDITKKMIQEEQSASGCITQPDVHPENSKIVDRVAKNYVNYVIEKNAAPVDDEHDDTMGERSIENEGKTIITNSHENDSTKIQQITDDVDKSPSGITGHFNTKVAKDPQETVDLQVKSSFDGSKLHEELRIAEVEAKLTTFKQFYNPFVLRKEIENASCQETSSSNNNERKVNHGFAEAAAALKIQSMWRGFKVRRKMCGQIIKGAKQRDENSNMLKENHVVLSDHKSTQDIIRAVITIQSLWRGYRTRMNLKGTRARSKRYAHSEDYFDTMLAAIRIQKVWRGFKARKYMKMQKMQHIDAGGFNTVEDKTAEASVPHPISKYSVPTVIDRKGLKHTSVHDSFDSDTKEHTEMNSLLDEILDYPVMEEQHLIDTYQNKLLDKISGKNDDLDKDIEMYKTLTSKSLRDSRSEGDKSFGSTEALLSPKPHVTKHTLESLAEEPTDESESSKLYTFCSVPSPITKEGKPLSDLIEMIDPKKRNIAEKPLQHSTSDSQLTVNVRNVKSPVRTMSLDTKTGYVKLLHTGEFHDSVVLPLPKDISESLKPIGGPSTAGLKSEEGKTNTLTDVGLLHTGELHDSIVLPLPKMETTDLGVGKEQGEASPGQPEAHTVVSVNFGNDAATMGVQVLQAPAAAAGVTSARAGGDVTEAAQTRVPSAPAGDGRKTLSATRQPSMGGEESVVSTQQDISMESEAARKIQAGFRGYQVRKQLKLKNGSSDMSNSKRLMKPKSSQPKAKEIEEKSAVKIQAGVRGFLVRRRQKKQINQ